MMKKESIGRKAPKSKVVKATGPSGDAAARGRAATGVVAAWSWSVMPPPCAHSAAWW